MIPIDIATAETLSFVGSCLQTSKAKILEVGAGEGDLALALEAAGHSVIALDACPNAVKRASAKGLQALLAEWPAYDGERVDVVLFTRSLHHMDDLEQALNRAVAMVRPDGLVIVDDFDYLEMDEKSIRWFYYQLRMLITTDLVQCPEDSFLARLQMTNGDPETWQQDHDHDLHTAAAMIQAMRRRMVDVQVERAPYLYRYLIPCLVNTVAGAELGAAFLDLEKTMGRSEWIPLIGRRIVGRVDGGAA